MYLLVLQALKSVKRVTLGSFRMKFGSTHLPFKRYPAKSILLLKLLLGYGCLCLSPQILGVAPRWSPNPRFSRLNNIQL